MAKYQIWNKIDSIITPIGEVLTPEQWIERYPVAGVPTIKFVIGGGEINGAFAGVFSSLVDIYKKAGCDFSACESDQDYLDAIEAFEDNPPVAEAEPTAEERIAAALEYQNLLSL